MTFLNKLTTFIAKAKKKTTRIVANLIRRVKAPPIPKNADGKVLIHLGCGPANDPRWINVDLLCLSHIHYIQDISKLDNFPDDTADLIYASHALEHIGRRALLGVLSEWRRVLKPGGVLRIAVPDFDYLINIYNSEGHDIGAIAGPLMGGQDYKYNFHYSVFNENYLSNLFKTAGFKEVRRWNPKTAPYHSFDDWSSHPYPINGHTYPVSLNLEAIK
ncbi:MAG: methyltransferase domain-containing protein [Patescibacteria group bacterium]